MYEMDFAGGKEVVTILGTPEVTESAVRVQLKNPNMEPNGKVVDVTCGYLNFG